MKKGLTIGLVLALAVMLVPGAVFAWEEPPATATWTVVNWGGTGAMHGSFAPKNDATYSFGTAGSGIGGTFFAQTSNASSAGVDGTFSSIQATVGNGWAYYQAQRTDSNEVAWGAPGQLTYSYVMSNAGTAEMATGSLNNACTMLNSTSGTDPNGNPWPATTNGYNFEANSTAPDQYQILSLIAYGATPLPLPVAGTPPPTDPPAASPTPTDIYGSFNTVGDGGTAKVNLTTASWSGVTGWKPPSSSTRNVCLGYGGGWPDGSWTTWGTYEATPNANAIWTGTGTATVNAVGRNLITTPVASVTQIDCFDPSGGTMTPDPAGWSAGGNGSFGSTTYQTVVTFTDGASVGNFSVDIK